MRCVINIWFIIIHWSKKLVHCQMIWVFLPPLENTTQPPHLDVAWQCLNYFIFSYVFAWFPYNCRPSVHSDLGVPCMLNTHLRMTNRSCDRRVKCRQASNHMFLVVNQTFFICLRIFSSGLSSLVLLTRRICFSR